jgi:hypothetical protein
VISGRPVPEKICRKASYIRQQQNELLKISSDSRKGYRIAVEKALPVMAAAHS